MIVDTYLILQHRIADILDQAAEFVRILDIVEKALDVSLVFQRS